MIITAFVLLFIYQIKHFLADFPLQRPWMLGKFRETGWFVPLAAHAGVHGAFSFLIVLAYSRSLFLACLLGGFDFAIHFVMDRVKASPWLMGRWKPLSPGEYKATEEFLHFCKVDGGYDECGFGKSAQKAIRHNTFFWWALGFDQMVHHLTHYVIIYQLLTIG